MKNFLLCMVLYVPMASLYEAIIFDEPEYIVIPSESEKEEISKEALNGLDLTPTLREPLIRNTQNVD